MDHGIQFQEMSKRMKYTTFTYAFKHTYMKYFICIIEVIYMYANMYNAYTEKGLDFGEL